MASSVLIAAKVVKTDAANDLALLKADGRFAPLPIAASRTVAHRSVNSNCGCVGTLAASGVPQCGMNYAVKSSLLLSFLEFVPDVAKKLKDPNTKDEKFEEVVKSVQDAAVLVLVY